MAEDDCSRASSSAVLSEWQRGLPKNFVGFLIRAEAQVVFELSGAEVRFGVATAA